MTNETSNNSCPGPQKTMNGLAVASLVLGILWLFWVGSFLAVIFGHVALHQISHSRGSQEGKGLAVAGVVLGWIGVGTFLLLFLLPVLLFA